jgi:hypothetical protein
MICKTIEIRDRGTFIPALAVRLIPTTEQDRYLLGRAGYGTDPVQQGGYVILVRIAGGNGQATSDPYDWDTRTMQAAHLWLIEHFDAIESGGVVDVEYLAGETAAPKRSEAETEPHPPAGRA